MWQIDNVSARQIKAARALLNWSQEDLAKVTHLSVATVRKLELGYISPRSTTTHVIRQAIEDAGLEFINAEGVRRRDEDVVLYRDPDGLEAFCDDISRTIKRNGGDIVIVSASESSLARSCGSEDYHSLERILSLNDATSIKCILTASTDQPISTPRFEFRFMSKHYIDPIPFYVYGNKFALVMPTEDLSAKVAVVQSTSLMQASLRQFHSMWDKATSLQEQAKTAAITDKRISQKRLGRSNT
jgi:transcriptional regulator with XRE-family HTH domain